VTQSLSNKTIAVTGGFGALGRAVGDALQAAGAQVALIDRTPAPAGLSSAVLALPDVDLGQADDAHRAMNEIVARFGGLDGLVNIAGGFRYETIEAGSIETWDRLFAINVRTALLASQAAPMPPVRRAWAWVRTPRRSPAWRASPRRWPRSSRTAASR
jgi:NAD(P)-dependent dehydrogenase (short-subunit alcohol dehydrogenase family)